MAAGPLRLTGFPPLGSISSDLAVDERFAKALHELPSATQNALSATSLNILHSPLKTLAAHLSTHDLFLVDCGGEGQCGPNTIGYLLGLAGVAIADGPQVRQAVVAHVGVTANRLRITRSRDPKNNFYTLEGLILRCVKDTNRGPTKTLPPSVEGWCQSIARPASWTDFAFLQVAADFYRVAISIHTVDDRSSVGYLGVVLPCAGTEPVALIEVGMWIGRHLVAVVRAAGAAAAGVGDSPQPRPPLDLDQIRTLLQSREAPTVLVSCEFSGALSDALLANGKRVLTCDLRPSLGAAPHYLGDVRDVVHLAHWEAAYFFPNCFQHFRHDVDCLPNKIDDGRAFWAGAFVLWCLCCPNASSVFVEQPDTIVYDYVSVEGWAELRNFYTSQYGDSPDKFVRLALRHASIEPPTLPRAPAPQARNQFRADHTTYPDQESRDRARSSWRSFPQLCAAMAAPMPHGNHAPAPSYSDLIQEFAHSWSQHGHPVPSDFLNADGQPSDAASRRYQLVRGPGDGRSLLGAIPEHGYDELPYTGESASHAVMLPFANASFGSLPQGEPRSPKPILGLPVPASLAKLADRLDAPFEPSDTSLAARSVQPSPKMAGAPMSLSLAWLARSQRVPPP